MDKMSRQDDHKKWTVARAKERFAQLLRESSAAPQRIYRRDQEVAVLVDASTFEEFERWRSAKGETTVDAAFEQLRSILREEKAELVVPDREDRPHGFPIGED